MTETPESILNELERRDPELALIAGQRSGAARLLTELPDRLDTLYLATDIESHRTWELAGLYFIRSGRLYEGLAIFWALYQQLLLAQQDAGWLHKGMPLVWMSDCYAQLGFPVHAKRYLMLTLVEDALREHGRVSPETTGTYFRLVWGYGLSHSEVSRYALDFHTLAEQSPERSLYPEALLQDVDIAWLTEFPSAREASHYRLNPAYAKFLLGRLGTSHGEALEQLAEYLLSCMPGCKTKRRQRSASTDYDVVCSMEGLEMDFRSELGRYFVCECKDWQSPVDETAMAKFCRVLDSTKARFGIVFSRLGLSGTGRTVFAEREQLKVFQDRGIVIVAVTQNDMDSVVQGANFISILRDKYESVRLDLR